jgi:hypothetical protein
MRIERCGHHFGWQHGAAIVALTLGTGLAAQRLLEWDGGWVAVWSGLVWVLVVDHVTDPERKARGESPPASSRR